jgi:DNA-binding NtrC family response regulator
MKAKIKIWVVDDERGIRVSLADDLRDAGYEVSEFANATAVLSGLTDLTPAIIISDIKMPGTDGIELLIKVKEINPDIFIIMMTAYGTVENAVKAMKLGAYDYITKPFNTEEIFLVINRILELNNYRKENKLLREKIESEYDFSSYIGDTNTNRGLFDLIQLVSHKDTTVLITGETGTGKELVTNIIHYKSSRMGQPLVKVSCAILSRDIFESELFGHVKGAFTGADNDKIGRFELADGGTIYLDDIDDISMDLQVKLLRVIEQREIEKVGSSKPVPVDVRIIASTKKDLFKLVNEGKFREDLYYRLNVFPIKLSPLRERKKDIKKILNHYLTVFSGKKNMEIHEAAFEQLYNYTWPGNIRELKNIAERLAILAGDDTIGLSHIPIELSQRQHFDICGSVGAKALDELLSEVEIAAIKCALERTNNKSKAAELLGLPVSTLFSRMEKYRIN